MCYKGIIKLYVVLVHCCPFKFMHYFKLFKRYIYLIPFMLYKNYLSLIPYFLDWRSIWAISLCRLLAYVDYWSN